MRRSPLLAWVLWTSSSCGRIGFESIEGPVASVPTALELQSRCGAVMTETGELEIANRGTDELTIASADTTGGFTVVTSLPLVIAPGESAKLTIRSPVAVVGTDRGGSIKSGTLVLGSDSVVAPPPIALQALVIGANVTVSGIEGQPSLAFDALGTMCPAGQFVVLHNDGNAAATVTSVTAPGMGFTALSTDAILEHGATLMHDVWLIANTCSGATEITYQLGGQSCTATIVLDVTYDLTGVPTCRCMMPVSPA